MLSLLKSLSIVRVQAQRPFATRLAELSGRAKWRYDGPPLHFAGAVTSGRQDGLFDKYLDKKDTCLTNVSCLPVLPEPGC
jgi:hypothetical protein